MPKEHRKRKISEQTDDSLNFESLSVSLESEKEKKSKKRRKDKNAQDFYDKKEEFLAWMAEIKGLNIESVNQFEEKRLFEEYVEDYNLANFPNKKYYDLQLYQKKLQQKAFIQQQQKELENIEMVVFNDEDQLKQKNKKQAEDFKKQQEQLQLQQLLQNQNIAKDIKEQQNIQNQLIQSYKTGDQQKVLELKKKLEPKKDENQGYQNQDDYI
ncbi:hypothetical protein PPERSA_08777 [Pseudocohnilembus persalinus]|uniref:Uncharacterized protein n=1 Tax=Pseudocohnilembus persalinus TaxID=266149 RepID=A0A0V0R7N0_PSEPJ|nr:hypothetical protein PPERSA_08777 [Pseudocohnilembus persalinus]|eukprot:KRX10475.1 hypothetical protein PPERSA_08777 [Pseudocohnilembus persalinus]